MRFLNPNVYFWCLFGVYSLKNQRLSDKGSRFFVRYSIQGFLQVLLKRYRQNQFQILLTNKQNAVCFVPVLQSVEHIQDFYNHRREHNANIEFYPFRSIHRNIARINQQAAFLLVFFQAFSSGSEYYSFCSTPCISSRLSIRLTMSTVSVSFWH